jgi:threonine dehydrogenase-like Zn-dependent dehydrogenase
MKGMYYDGQVARLRHDLPEPRPFPGEVVLRVRAAGVCGTDLQITRGYFGFRGVLGHEFVAEDAGGRRVAAEINFACHACTTCARGDSNHCPTRTVLGIVGRDGAMAELVSVPERNLHAVPEVVSDAEAVFIEPLAAAFRMVEQVEVSAGTAVCVLGDGKLGLLCTYVARDRGARVTLVGRHADKLALAGAGVATCTSRDAGALGRPFDVVVEATGSAAGLAQALTLVRPRGVIVLKSTVAARYEIDLAPVVVDEVRVVGSRCGPFPPAIAALAARRIDVRPLIQAELPLDQAEAALRLAGEPGARKVLLRVG